MTNLNLSPFSFPVVGRKAVTAAFDDGRLTSDGGLMPLSMAECRLGITQRLLALTELRHFKRVHYQAST